MISTKKNIDWILIFLVTSLCVVGLFVLYSAGFSPTLGESLAIKRQSASMLVGMVLFFIAMFVGPKTAKTSSYFIYFICCVLLVAVLLVGDMAGGARRWVAVAGIRVQPSEFMKLGIILAVARYLSDDKIPSEGFTVPTLIVPSVIIFVPALLILKQPDLGTALINIMVGASMILLAGVNTKTLIRLFLVAICSLLPAWNFVLKDYQKQRVLTFMSPESDPLGAGYHALQSKIAVGSGAVFGKGYFQGTQTQLRFLPEQTTDFVFSVLAEEWGYLGSTFVICLYGFLIYRILLVGQRCQDKFGAFVSIGVASLIFWHLIINIGMVIGILPVVGVTLTLLSFGGSSVVTVLAGIGIVAGFSMRRYFFS